MTACTGCAHRVSRFLLAFCWQGGASVRAQRLEALQRHCRQQQEELAHGPGYADDDLVFTRRDGRPYEPDEFSRDVDRKQKRLGLPRIRLRDLRHTWATLALPSDVHPTVVSQRLGHSTVAMTSGTCSHVTPSLQKEAADQVADVILGDGRCALTALTCP